jgi:hypothetical protein
VGPGGLLGWMRSTVQLPIDRMSEYLRICLGRLALCSDVPSWQYQSNRRSSCPSLTSSSLNFMDEYRTRTHEACAEVPSRAMEPIFQCEPKWLGLLRISDPQLVGRDFKALKVSRRKANKNSSSANESPLSPLSPLLRHAPSAQRGYRKCSHKPE